MKTFFSHLLSSAHHGSAVTFLNTHMTMKSRAVRTVVMFLLSSEAGGLSTRSTETSLTHTHIHFASCYNVVQWTLRLTSDRHLLAIEDRQPQVMRIHHSDDDYDDEGSQSHSFSSDDITKDRTVCRDTSSPDSSFQSPSTGK